MLGERLKFARESMGLRQTDAADILSISVSGVSEMENGSREPKAAQLAKLAGLYHRTMDFFFVATPLRKDVVLWRCRPDDDAEAMGIQREFFKLCEDYRRLEELTGEERGSDLPFESGAKGQFGYPQAEALALRMSEELQLGVVPGQVLKHVLEENYNVRVFALPMSCAASGLCIRDERLGVCVLLNADNVNWRRNFDLAHELFHLLTWDIFRGYANRTAVVADSEEEALANTFAGRLLLPENHFKQRLYAVCHERMTPAGIHELAREFGVSAETVIYRCAGIFRWQKERTREIVGAIKDFHSSGRRSRGIDALPARYVHLVVLAYRRGMISFGRAGKYLKLGHKEAARILESTENGIDLDSQIATIAD